MNLAESKRITQTYQTAYLNNVEAIENINPPVLSATSAVNSFEGRRVYFTGIKFWFTFRNLNVSSDKMVCIKIFCISPNENLADTEIYNNTRLETDSTLAALPFIERPKAKINSHSTGYKEVWRKNIVLENNNASNVGKTYRHWKTWIPINEVLKLETGEDNGPDVLNKRYQMRTYVINADGITTTDPALQVIGGQTESVLYFKDI